MSHATSSGAQADSNCRDMDEVDSVLGPLESLAATDSEPSSRYNLAQGQNSRNAPLEESSFPPLPKSTRSSRQRLRNELEGLGRNTMAARLRRRNTVNVLHSTRAWPAVDRQPTSSMSTSPLRPTSSSGFVSSSASACSSTSLVTSNHATSAQNRPATAHGLVPENCGSSLSNTTGSKVKHSASAPNLADGGNFPPVSSTRTNKLATISQHWPKVEDVHTANKSLVERVRAGLEFDEDKYAAFKEISAEYRKGLIETGEYLAYVHQFDLSHLILELARLCPDAQKQNELLEVYNTRLPSNGPHENSAGKNSSQLSHKKGSQKGKEKFEDNGPSSKAALADGIINDARELQSGYNPPGEEAEVFSKGGCRSAKGKSKVFVGLSSLNHPQTESNSGNDSQSTDCGSKKTGVGNKQRRKPQSSIESDWVIIHLLHS